MPFKSEAQSRFMHSQHPEIASKWDKEFPGPRSLPQYVHMVATHIINKVKRRKNKRSYA